MAHDSVDAKNHIDRPAAVTLIGINDTDMPQYDLGSSVEVSFGLGGERSGEILGVLLVMQEDGSGAIIAEDGELYIFDQDPSISAGAAVIPTAAAVNCLGKISITAADWDSDANGAIAYITDTPVAFDKVGSLWLAYRHAGATTINSAAGDDEKLRCVLTIRYDR